MRTIRLNLLELTYMANDTSPIDPQRPSLGPAPWFQRLAAGFYDAFILLALWLLSGSILAFVSGGFAPAMLVQGVLLLLAWGFFGYLWTKSGRTLGMQAWHLRVESQTGTLMNWKQATTRFAWCALFIGGFWQGLILLGAGQPTLGAALVVAGAAAFLSAVGQPDRRTWYDRASGTRLVQVPKVKWKQ